MIKRLFFAALMMSAASGAAFAQGVTPNSHNGTQHSGGRQDIGVPDFQGRPPVMPSYDMPTFRGDNLGDHIAVRNLNLNNNKIINLADPTAPQDGVNLRTVETLVAGARDNMGDQIARNGPVYLNGFALMTGNRLIDPANGNLTVENGMTIIGQHIYDAHLIRGLLLPVQGSDAANKDYVDALRNDLTPQIPILQGGDGISIGRNGRQMTISVNATVVRTSGVQSIAGQKTFTSVPRSNVDPTDGRDLVRLSYLNTRLGNFVTLDTDQTITGTKTFSAPLNLTTNQILGRNTSGLYIDSAGLLALRPTGNFALEGGGSVRLRSASFMDAFIPNTTSGSGFRIYAEGNNTHLFHVNPARVSLNIPLHMGNQKITNLADPTAAQDAVNLRTLNARNYTSGDGITVNNTNRTIAVNDTVVRTSGNQTIGGNKTFTGRVRSAEYFSPTNGPMTLESFSHIYFQSNNGGLHLRAGVEGNGEMRAINLRATGGIYMETGLGGSANGANNTGIQMVSAGPASLRTPLATAHNLTLETGGHILMNMRSQFQLNAHGTIQFSGGNYNNYYATTMHRFYVGNTPGQTGGTHRYSITSSGGANASDERLKQNIVTMENGLDIIRALRPVSYDWKDNGDHSYGVIAQEVLDVIPHAVILDEEIDRYSVNYTEFIAPLIGAVKTLEEEKAELEAKVEGYEAIILELAERVKNLEER